jgi:hypothetical protein
MKGMTRKETEILVRFLERRLNQSLRIVPGTLVERYGKVQAELQRRGRDFEIINLLYILRCGFGQTRRYAMAMNISRGTLKQIRRRILRIEQELRERGELSAE